ncbi:MAG: tetratricopeptide repeat protein [Labilithrix sp.]|nr:tetratricopeptide repeat protein [Labilithrix sp.]MCW5813521.1 tetratricopeptide repeat protein [Labilithrix sp.]
MRVSSLARFVVSFMLCMALASSAFAEDNAAGGPALRAARAAWDRGSLETAEPLYREALEKGGLAPPEVLEGYVRLGAIRAALGKKDQAIAAFKAASIIDATFTLPPEGRSRSAPYAEKAKRDTAKIGSIQLGIKTVKETASGKPFKVTATLDKGHLPIVAKIGVVAKDGTTGKEISLDAKPDESVEFEIGPEVTLPGASIVVRVDALDNHQNRIASVEERVRVPPEYGTGGGPATGPSSSSSSTTGPAASTGSGFTAQGPQAPRGDQNLRRGGGFWSSPWPYVIGGVVLAGVGSAVFFGTRPPANLDIDSPRTNDR